MDRCVLAYMATSTFDEYSKGDNLDNELWTFAEYTSSMYGIILDMIFKGISGDVAVHKAFKEHSKEEYEDAKVATKNYIME